MRPGDSPNSPSESPDDKIAFQGGGYIDLKKLTALSEAHCIVCIER